MALIGVDYNDNGANHIRLSVLVNKYQKNHKRNKCNEKYLRHYLTGNLGNGLVYPYKCPSAYTRRALLEYA